MKIAKLSLLGILLSFFAAAQLQAAAENGGAGFEEASVSYRLGAGDVLDISVWKDEALTRTVTVLPDGTISFPLVGRLPAEGKSVSEFKEELENRLTRYVPDPVLSLEVRQVNSMQIYVIGRVRNPGRFVLSDQITILQALALAGGFDPFAQKNDVKVFRQSGERTLVLSFSYDEVVKAYDLRQNVQLERGDTIVVP